MSRGRAIPAVLTLLTGLGALGWLTAVTLSPSSDAPYLPDDGHVAAAATLGGDLVQLEHAVLPLGLLDGPMVRSVIAEQTLDPTATALRVTVAPGAPEDQLLFAVDDGELTLRGFSLDGVGRLFPTGLPLEAGDLSGEMLLPDGARVAYVGAVAIAGGACDDITATLDVSGVAETISLTMCDGAGPTTFRAELAGGTVGFTASEEPVPFAETSLEVPDRDWTAAAAWEPTGYVPTARDAFGEIVSARGLVGSPAALLGGQVAFADRYAEDVVVLRPDAGGVADVAWRGHPGGHVVQVVAVGDMVVAVRTGGSMVGYSVDGVRIWESDVATESVVGSVVGVTGRLTFATLDGTIWMLDAATGEPMWSHRFAERLASGVVADERVTFAFDTEGRMVGYAASGEQAFDGEVPSPFEVVALDEANSYLARSGQVEAYELQYSQYQWASDLPGPATAMCSTEDRLVVLTPGGAHELDPATGAIVASHEAADALECGRGAVALAAGHVIEIRTTAGDTTTLQVPDPVVGVDYRRTAPAPGGLWVFADQALVWWSA